MSTLQEGWRWCHKCEGLFFASDQTQGSCPADLKQHDASESGAYVTVMNAETAPAGGGESSPSGVVLPFSAQQGGWRHCIKCEGLFFAQNATPGSCPAGEMHLAVPSHKVPIVEPAHYAVVKDDGHSNLGQKDWRWCYKCQGLFFNGHTTQGVCPANGAHDPNPLTGFKSGEYQLQFDTINKA